MYQVPCPPEITKIQRSYTSSETSDSLEYWWNESEDNMTDPNAIITTVITMADLSDLITKQTRNNFSQVQRLRYFCAGRTTHPEFPGHIFEANPRSWMEDIETRTIENWTDAGRIQLAKQYAKGPAQVLLIIIEQKMQNPLWQDVKKELLETFPDDKTLTNSLKELGEANRRPGETLREFYIRLYSMKNTIYKLKSGHESITH